MRADSRGVIKYRRRRHINIGMIVFAMIFFYLTIYMIIYFTREKVGIYEVVLGKNAGISNQSYSGLILRDEYVFNADASGYLNYFVKEGDRVSVKSTVYTIDESGTVNKLLSSAAENGDITISDEAELHLRKMVSEYTASYDDMAFSQVYSFKQDIDARILESINLNNIQNLLSSNIQSSGMNFKIHNAEKTGIAMCYTDGYEGKTEQTLTAADFDTEKYAKKPHTSGELIENGAPVYKIVNTENWWIYVKLSEDDVKKYSDTDVVRIKILSDNREMDANFAICTIDGQSYGKISLLRYMSTYAGERFLNIQIIENVQEGLKIPKTSVTEKDFYIIPVSYASKGGNSSDVGFYKKTYDKNQNESVVFVTPVIYKVTDEFYYVDARQDSSVSEGDFIVPSGGGDAYRVSQKAALKGAYNINNGYCVFRNVDILTETGEYYLVGTGTSYGLKVYDHIVIDSSMVHENQVVFSVK